MSDRLPWFRCFPSALLGALAGLDPDEGLVYVTALLRIYETGGPVAETARTLARRTGLNERRAGAALERLLDAGKVILTSDSRLDSASTHAEIGWQRERHEEQSAAGRASAAKRQKQGDKKNDASGKSADVDDTQKDQQNQRSGATRVERPFNHLEEDTDRDQVQASPSPETLARESFPPKAFDQFWIRYPHKVGKDAAVKAFEARRKSGRVMFPHLMTGLDRYIASKPPDRSWCNPATWLNQGRYDDEPSTDDARNQRNQSAGVGRSGTAHDAVAAAMARHATRLGIGSGRREDGDRSENGRDHGPRRDDPEIEDAHWTPAGGYRAAH